VLVAFSKMEELYEKSKVVKDDASMSTAHLELQVRRPLAESVQQLLWFISKSCILIQSIDARPPILLKYHLISDSSLSCAETIFANDNLHISNLDLIIHPHSAKSMKKADIH